MYGVLIDQKKFGMDRDTLREQLAKNGIDTRDFFYPPEEQPVLKNIVKSEKFANAAYAGHNGLYLPSGLAITETQIDYVVETIKKIAGK
jgi:perosamine synthetase